MGFRYLVTGVRIPSRPTYFNFISSILESRYLENNLDIPILFSIMHNFPIFIEGSRNTYFQILFSDGGICHFCNYLLAVYIGKSRDLLR